MREFSFLKSTRTLFKIEKKKYLSEGVQRMSVLERERETERHEGTRYFCGCVLGRQRMNGGERNGVQ